MLISLKLFLNALGYILNLPKSKLVRSVLLPAVKDFIASQKLDKFIDSKAVTGVSEKISSFQNKFNVWSHPVFQGNCLEHCYPVAGATEAINYWLQFETRQIYMIDGDYDWISEIYPKKIIKVKNWKLVPHDAVIYVSNPSAVNGCYREDWLEMVQSGIPLVLDCVYVGTAELQKITISESVEKIFFSFSKNFALSSFRMGWLWSRSEISCLRKLSDYKYTSTLNVHLSLALMERFPINYLYLNLKELHKEVCENLRVIKSDSVLLGYSPFSDFPSFRRGTSLVSRLPLAEYYDQKI